MTQAAQTEPEIPARYVHKKRSEAEKILYRVRTLLAERVPPEKIEQVLAETCGIPPLEKCTGEAHSNLHQDHCGVCMPRWGWTGPEVKIR